MLIMFVCTGNICRSPMGELLLAHYLAGTTVRVTSAGTRGLPQHPMDPSSAKLMSSVGIDSSRFRSKRLTADMVQSADLILCFEERQRKDIVSLDPSAVQYTFLLTEFAKLCEYCGQHRMVVGLTIQQRLYSVIVSAPAIRPLLPKVADIADIEDPHGKDFGEFRRTAEQMNQALRMVLTCMRKHYYDEFANKAAKIS
ncbi:arsenate reductase/protein-tyrosine-phosphatase family protein [Bifidobacterium xylocopae]|uniref:Low molecular weight phosphatase family protein n=1 Tax=Bifidobacterium xylocopae TaxID=2493119 RepID=A0A366KDQ1_9BIFI|nr:low molecular weight phosphatase family protein [Bifidobacterium xylocopae]RBP99699.1 low molecular weight phosphatase family protein [Bifidobacterium xylocopae]